MRKIDLDESDDTFTIMSYGSSGAGKTRWAASWPDPLFLCDQSERGWTTIKTMPKDAFFDPKRPPTVWTLEKAADAMTALKDLKAELEKEPGKYKTVVVDSITLHADMMLNAYKTSQPPGKDDMRAVYSSLLTYLQNMQLRFHELPCNVIWTALPAEPDPESGTLGGPLVPGQAKMKLAARCDFVFYHQSVQAGGQPPRWELRTRQYGRMFARGRAGTLFPDPITDPTYRGFMAALEQAKAQPEEAAEEVADDPAQPAAQPQGRPAVVARPQARPTVVRR